MTHDEAIQEGATERYVLDEMTDEEREAFERHYFDCDVCAEDVRAAIAIRDGLAAVVEPAVVVPIERRRLRIPSPLAAAAAAAIVTVSLYAGVIMPQGRRLAEAMKPRLIEQVQLAAVRGPEDTVPVADANKSFDLNIDLEATEDKSPQYTFVILDSSGQQQFPVAVAGERARTKVVTIEVPGGALKPGTYTLRVDGTEAGVATYRFVIR